ncbi:MAG: transposase [Deltaproteobacteria bacterium]|nr:transposase [Deltaproteobacteria bacterium]
MPRPRAQLVSLAATPYYHCISRCVRRAFLCGQDPLTGSSFDHRKQWLADRMQLLSQIFAVDVCAYGLMSNHFHAVLHIDRDRAESWSEEEVAKRYTKLFRHTVKQARQLPPEQWQRKVKQWRKRLWNLSWFMRCLNESIARRANHEDRCTGRFWEGRFRSQALLDTGALLTCMAYVDLNPIRAGITTALEESEFTSIRQRLLAAARSQGACKQLLPFVDQAVATEHSIPMQFGDYVELLRWTAALVGAEPSGAPLPANATLHKLGLDSTGFVGTICNYARRFFTMVGQVHRIDAESRRRGYKRRPGIRGAQQLYRTSAA